MGKDIHGKKNADTLPYLISVYRGHVREIGILLLLLLLLAAVNAFLPRYSARIIDEGFVIGDAGMIVRLALVILLLSVIVSLLYVAIEYFRLKGYNAIQTELKEKVLNKLLHVDYSFFNKRSAPEVYQQFDEDVTAICGCFSSETLLILASIAVSLFIVPALAGISWKLFAVLLLAVPFELLKTALLSRTGYRVSRNRIEAKTRYSAWMADVISGYSVIRSFGLASHFYQLFRIRQRKVADMQIRQGMVSETMIRIDAVLIDLLTFIIYVVGGYLVAGAELSLGNFVAFEAYSLSLLSMVGRIMGIAVGYAQMKPSLERFLSFMDEEDETSGTEKPEEEFRELRFEKVSFSYEPGTELIRDIKLTVHRGEHIAFWGDNGSGKTTIINLVLRVINPDAGVIRLNETDVRHYAVDEYRQLFAVAPQNPFIFCDSIRNNVALYSSSVSDEQILKALDQVGLRMLVDEKGLDYNVGQNGCELSGGQRQRLSLARTLVINAPFVILDEPEVSIDNDFEQRFEMLMTECFQNKTLIVVTHRPEIMNKMDCAYVMRNGSVVPWSEEVLDGA